MILSLLSPLGICGAVERNRWAVFGCDNSINVILKILSYVTRKYMFYSYGSGYYNLLGLAEVYRCRESKVTCNKR